MRERRTLAEGLKPSEIDPEVAQAFIRGELPSRQEKPAPETNDAGQPPIGTTISGENRDAAPHPAAGGELSRNATTRVPLTTRVRSDYAAALKRASLERQLGGVFPNTLQDILEEALQPWLRSNGYLN